MTDHLLFNAAAASTLGLVAFASRWLNRPAITHTLWLLVFARLLAPPILILGIPSGAQPEPPALVVQADTPDLRSDVPVLATSTQPALQSYSPSETAPVRQPLDWSLMAAVVWWSGSVFMAASWIRGFVQMRILIRRGRPTRPEFENLVGELARAVGLRKPPRVVEVGSHHCPCVVATGREALLLLPRGWLESLDSQQRSAVLIHEIAHLRRHDHLTRWLEAAVGIVYWWHPIVWLARNELREAEELCCDGWVVATLPTARRAYADALVDTLDYLASAKSALPTLASGFGRVRELRRRLHMILTSSSRFRSGRAGALLALCFGLFLPVSVSQSVAQDNPPPPPPPPPPRPSAPSRAEPPAPPRGERPGRPPAERGDAGARNPQMAELRRALQEANARVAEAQAEVERIRAKMEAMARDMNRAGEAPRGEGRGGGDARGGDDRPRGRGEGRGGPEGPRGRGEGPPPGERRPDGPPRPDGRPVEGPRRTEGRAGDADRRIAELEEQLNRLRRELDALRRDSRPPAGR